MKLGTVWDCVGNTPLVKIRSLSDMTGCEILGKAEFLNPGGSIKDRAAKGIITAAEKSKSLGEGGTIVEGTAGNTGIGIATLAAERGYRVIISMPDNQSPEKMDILRALGVELRLVPPCPFTDQKHFYHQAKKIAETIPGAFWANQFENLSNSGFHYQTTGPEIWDQVGGKVDFLTLSVGTGGTIGGVSKFLKERNKELWVVLADPMGSGLYSYVKSKEIKCEGTSITEGIGIMRITANFREAVIDDAVQVNDQDMIDMLYHVAKSDGLFVGTSSAINLVSAYRLGRKNQGKGKRIVTFLCDYGGRYASRILKKEWLEEKGLRPKPLGNSQN